MKIMSANVNILPQALSTKYFSIKWNKEDATDAQMYTDIMHLICENLCICGKILSDGSVR